MQEIRFEDVETVILPLNEILVETLYFFFLFCIKSICLHYLKHNLFMLKLIDQVFVKVNTCSNNDLEVKVLLPEKLEKFDFAHLDQCNLG